MKMATPSLASAHSKGGEGVPEVRPTTSAIRLDVHIQDKKLATSSVQIDAGSHTTQKSLIHLTPNPAPS